MKIIRATFYQLFNFWVAKYVNLDNYMKQMSSLVNFYKANILVSTTQAKKQNFVDTPEGLHKNHNPHLSGHRHLAFLYSSHQMWLPKHPGLVCSDGF